MAGSRYAGRRAALATRHGKQEVIAPVFRTVTGIEVELCDVDTDAFGTFAGEVPRLDTPRNTAIAKARAAVDASGLRLGVASEGTIGPDPLLPFTTSDLEIITFVDADAGLVITEWETSTDIVAFRQTIRPTDDLGDVMVRADFPRHGLIVRSHEGPGALIVKGITQESELIAAIAECAALNGTVVVESDLRAQFSPSRMAVIASCAARLAERLATPCPECSSPGWGRIEPARGVPCAACGQEVASAVRADRLGCPACPAQREIPRSQMEINPRWCSFCNP